MKREFTVSTSIFLDRDEVIKIVKDYLVARGVMDHKEAQSALVRFEQSAGNTFSVVEGLRFYKDDTNTESLQV